jgi:hypothetical protein
MVFSISKSAHDVDFLLNERVKYPYEEDSRYKNKSSFFKTEKGKMA